MWKLHLVMFESIFLAHGFFYELWCSLKNIKVKNVVLLGMREGEIIKKLKKDQCVMRNPLRTIAHTYDKPFNHFSFMCLSDISFEGRSLWLSLLCCSLVKDWEPHKCFSWLYDSWFSKLCLKLRIIFLIN